MKASEHLWFFQRVQKWSIGLKWVNCGNKENKCTKYEVHIIYHNVPSGNYCKAVLSGYGSSRISFLISKWMTACGLFAPKGS